MHIEYWNTKYKVVIYLIIKLVKNTTLKDACFLIKNHLLLKAFHDTSSVIEICKTVLQIMIIQMRGTSFSSILDDAW